MINWQFIGSISGYSVFSVAAIAAAMSPAQVTETGSMESPIGWHFICSLCVVNAWGPPCTKIRRGKSIYGVLLPRMACCDRANGIILCCWGRRIVCLCRLKLERTHLCCCPSIINTSSIGYYGGLSVFFWLWGKSFEHVYLRPEPVNHHFCSIQIIRENATCEHAV